MISSRTANIIAIVNRDGDIVWRLGPDYQRTRAGKNWTDYRSTQSHLIPKGLPGEVTYWFSITEGRAVMGLPIQPVLTEQTR